MAMKQCANGHLYDDSKSLSCPYCSGENAIGSTIPLGAPIDDSLSGGFSATQMLGQVPTVSLPSEMPVTIAPENAPKGQMVTTFIEDQKNSEILPVRGWLVVVEGEKIGMDFRLHTARNTIGRGKNNDVCFDFDSAVSKENNASVVYDDENNLFFITFGEGKNNIHVNGELLLAPRQLKDNDIIKIGKTKLVFRSLCNESFNYPVAEKE